MEIWELKPPGTVWTTPGLLRDCFTFNERTTSDEKCYEMSAEQLRRVSVTSAVTETLIIVVNKVTTVNKRQRY